MKFSKKDLELFFLNADEKKKKKAIKLIDRINRFNFNQGGGANGTIDNTYRVLWVRHCESCANKAISRRSFSLMRKMFRQPLCTSVGIVQALTFGINLKKKYPLISFKFFSSFLPRAMLTSKLISAGLYGVPAHAANINSDSTANNVYLTDKITPIQFISEKTGWYNSNRLPQTQSRSKKIFIKTYIDILNTFFNGLDINDKDIPVSVESRNDDYTRFKSNISMLDFNTINIVVSHGGYIKDYIFEEIKNLDRNNQLGNLPTGFMGLKHPDNLSGYLVEYDYYGNMTKFIEYIKLDNSIRDLNATNSIKQKYKKNLSTPKSYASKLISCNYSYNDLANFILRY